MDQPGIWQGTDDIQVDLLVPESVGGPGRRSARLEGHSKRTARKVDGLEGALVETQIETIGSFREDDDRRFNIRVAGSAALLVAKLYKVWERREEPRRLENKDAADIFRLLQAIPTDKLIAGLAKLRSDPISATVSANGFDFLQRLFGQTEGLGIKLLRAAVDGLDDPDVAAASCLELAKDLIQATNNLGL